MGQKEKLILLDYLEFTKSNKGKTSGSRVMFTSEEHGSILLHKPHPQKELKAYQVRQLCDLLEQGTVPNEAYLLCGFKDYANFYRAFRSAYGQSPREYARAHRKAKARTTKFCF